MDKGTSGWRITHLREQNPLLRLLSAQGLLIGGWLTFVFIKIQQHGINCWGWLFKVGSEKAGRFGDFPGVQF